MKITYMRIWDIGKRDEAEIILTIEQDWVPAVGTSVYFAAGIEGDGVGKTAGTVVDVEMLYPGGSLMPRVEVWLK